MRISGMGSDQVELATKPVGDPALQARIGPLNQADELVRGGSMCTAVDASELRDDEWLPVANSASDSEIAMAGAVWSQMQLTGTLPTSAETLSGSAAKIISTASILAGSADAIREIAENRPKVIESTPELNHLPWAW
jgi:ABC-type phosphate/phosphonate transport system ATPase subunit